MSRSPRISRSRREFLKASGLVLTSAGVVPAWMADLTYGEDKPAEKRKMGAIGVGGQGTGIMLSAQRFAHIVAVADVDKNHANRAKDELAKRQPDVPVELFGDYRKLLDNKDISCVTIGTPDHWHTKVLIDAMKAGKDVYCEKPLTLTVDEGKQILKVQKETGRVVQVGTQQRSDVGLFLRAIATVRAGQLGKIQKVTVQLPLSTAEGGPFETKPVPENLDWNQWLGQAKEVGYCPERAHFSFRWWFEYSGGILTDWGAHHIDICQWALGQDKSGPLTIDGSETKLPTVENGYNTPKNPKVIMTYPGDIVVEVTTGNEGLLFEGTEGRMFVNRGRVTGKVIEEQDKDQGLKDKVMAGAAEVYGKDRPAIGHMEGFFRSMDDRTQPISDAESQHRSVSTCHLGNISIRLQRKLTWDPAKEEFVGDDEANAMLKREQRSPFAIEA
jgi:myo-inositol 2-dehydrogenase / D-chiro-inositol 1-dehydrogenase